VIYRRLGLPLVAIVFLLIAAPVVFGHAELEESNPAEGSTVTTPLDGSLTFDDELATDPADSFVVIVDAEGVEVARGKVSSADDMKMDIRLPELGPGEYTLRWQATAADDDFVSRDEFTFTVALEAASGGPTAAPTSTPTGGDEPGEGSPTGDDLTLALIVAALAIAGVLAFVFLRIRRR
jgi:methionine-rich copper-binding protein CopC